MYQLPEEADLERLEMRLMWDVYLKWVQDPFFFFEEENGVEHGWEERNREQRRKVKKFEWRTKRIPDSLLYRMKPSIEKKVL